MLMNVCYSGGDNNDGFVYCKFRVRMKGRANFFVEIVIYLDSLKLFFFFVSYRGMYRTYIYAFIDCVHQSSSLLSCSLHTKIHLSIISQMPNLP